MGGFPDLRELALGFLPTLRHKDFFAPLAGVSVAGRSTVLNLYFFHKSKRRSLRDALASLQLLQSTRTRLERRLRQSQIREAASLVGAVNLKSTRRYAQSLSASLSAIYNCLILDYNSIRLG